MQTGQISFYGRDRALWKQLLKKGAFEKKLHWCVKHKSGRANAVFLFVFLTNSENGTYFSLNTRS